MQWGLVCVAIDRTAGWQREKATIPIPEYAEESNVCLSTAKQQVRALVGMGVLRVVGEEMVEVRGARRAAKVYEVDYDWTAPATLKAATERRRARERDYKRTRNEQGEAPRAPGRSPKGLSVADATDHRNIDGDESRGLNNNPRQNGWGLNVNPQLPSPWGLNDNPQEGYLITPNTSGSPLPEREFGDPKERKERKEAVPQAGPPQDHAASTPFAPLEHERKRPHSHSVDQSISPEKPQLNRDRGSRTDGQTETTDRPTDGISNEEAQTEGNGKVKNGSGGGTVEKPWHVVAASAEAVPDADLTEEHLGLAKAWAGRMGFGGYEDVAKIARVAYVCGEATFIAVSRKCADTHKRGRVLHPWALFCTAVADAMGSRPADGLASRIRAAPTHRSAVVGQTHRDLVGGQTDKHERKSREEEEAIARKHNFILG